MLHEAGNDAKAVVLPIIGDFAEMIQDEGYTGACFEPEDPASLADAIQHDVMQNDLAAVGIPMGKVVDWYLMLIERLLDEHMVRSRLAAEQR